jgi:Zn-dependent peptidase ImmA (M78 family)
MVEPSILKYARYYSGYDLEEVAKKAKINSGVLKSLEETSGEISIAKLETIAEIYKRPVAYFLLKEVPKDVVLPKDFRIIYEAEDDHLSPKVLLAVRKARYIQSIISDLSFTEIEYQFGTISINSDVEKVADNFRKIIDISIQQQSKWYQPSTALKEWKEAVERLQIFVIQQSLKREDVSAFCLADKKPYVVSLDSSEHENRRIFSLFHEIGHVLLHSSGVCNINNQNRNSSRYIKIEKFCNQFAASFLVPKSHFLENEIVKELSKKSFSDWDKGDIKTLSLKYRVSQEVIYRRLVSVGILSDSLYQKKRAELIKGFDEYKKKIQPKEMKIPYHVRVISQNGRGFVGLISENLNSNRITMADASDYLGVSSGHVSRVISEF